MKNEEGLSDFLKMAYKHNRVRDLNEAFEKYPVEEEWHKGKVENVLMESPIGDVVQLVNFSQLGTHFKNK